MSNQATNSHKLAVSVTQGPPLAGASPANQTQQQLSRPNVIQQLANLLTKNRATQSRLDAAISTSGKCH
jgi:hypothetical protein